MQVIAKPTLLVLVPSDEAEARAFDAFADGREGRVFRLTHAGRGYQLVDLGPEDAVRRVPINITSSVPAPLDLISNFAPTPFELDGRDFASVEGFWQSLKFADEADRTRIAALSGAEAKQAGRGARTPATFAYDDRTIRSGTHEHWRLMRRACEAKFRQNAPARAALLSTGDRPLTHKTRPDSKTIPGVLMADIWMRLRERCRTW